MRGIVGGSLTPEVALRYACAFAAEAPSGALIVTRDGRASGAAFARAVAGGLLAMGRDVVDAGVSATPTTGVLVRQLRAAGGIQVSASHNPPEYNGLKLFSAAGRVIPAAEGLQVLTRFHSGQSAAATHEADGAERTCHDTTGEHLRLVLQCVDAERIRARRFRVLLDANHGAGSLLGRRLLDELGCEAIILGDVPDGRFAHPPEPTAENLAGVLRRVAEERCDLGFCQDPDADRLAIVDEAGRYLGEELTLALCVEHVLRQRPGPIVTNCSTSRMAEDIARRHGVPFYRSAVGEANVVDEMLRRSAVLGGEGNGGVIDPRVVLVRDSFVGMALLLDALAARERGTTIGRLAAELPRYEIIKTKVSLSPEKLPVAYAALERHFHDAAADRLDGLRLDWPAAWLLVRPSNTEPIVRIIAEAPTAEEAVRLCRNAGAVVASA